MSQLINMLHVSAPYNCLSTMHQFYLLNGIYINYFINSSSPFYQMFFLLIIFPVSRYSVSYSFPCFYSCHYYIHIFSYQAFFICIIRVFFYLTIERRNNDHYPRLVCLVFLVTALSIHRVMACLPITRVYGVVN